MRFACVLLSLGLCGCAAGMAPKFSDASMAPGAMAEQSAVAQSAEQEVERSYQLASNAPTTKSPKKAQGSSYVAPKRAAPAVVYLGYLRLQVKRLIEAIDTITAMTQAAGGYIESMGARHLVVRIPASDFDAVMERLASVGVTLDRRVKALDVTAQFTDLKARLAVSVQARTRMLALLEQVKDVQERLKILEEIKRLSEQIESVESTLSVLKNMMDYFTITIELVPVVENDREVSHRSPFEWVRNLSAHQVTLEDGKSEVAMTIPTGFVLFDEDDVFRAQAADTSMIRAAVVPNEPLGDGAFWSEAVHHELDGRDEELVENGERGGLSFRTYRNKDTRPRYYTVAVHTQDDELFVVEAFYPNEDAYEAHHDQVIAALATFEVK